MCCLVLAARAEAGSDVVVLGPAASGAAPPAALAQVKASLERVGLAPSTHALDAACATDASCLVNAGTELAAQRVLAVVVTAAGGQVTISASLVDVIGKEMIAVRDLPVAEKRLAKDAGPLVKKFLDEAPTDRAKALFVEGNQHYNLGEMQQALELYKRAYRIKPLPAFQFNIAQCHRKLGHFQEAITMYQAYLVGVPNASNKSDVESLIAESQKAIADQQAAATGEERMRFETEKKKAEDARKAKEAEALAAAEQRKAEQLRIEHDKELYDRHPARIWMIGTATLGVGALVTGAVFGVKARNLQSSFDSQGCGTRSQLLSESQVATCDQERKDGPHDATLSNAFLIGGGAALVASAIVFALDPGNVDRPESPAAHVAFTPTSIQWVMSW